MRQGCLGDFVDFAYGKALPERDRKPGSVLVFGSAGHIGSHHLPLVEGPGVIIGRKGTVGSVHWSNKDFYPIDTTFYIVLKENDLRLRYIFYLLNTLPLRYMNTDVAVPGLNRTNALRLPVTIVSPAAQDYIVEILSSYDDLIENNRRRIQLLEQAARLLYKEWFVRLRFPGHERVKIVDGVPEGWERKYVSDVIDVNPTEKIPKGNLIRYVPMAGLSTTGMSIDLVESEFRTTSTSVRYRNGDVLFARITPCLENGKTGFVNFLAEDEIACGSTEFIVLRGNLVNQYFTYCLARTYDFRENAIKSMIGSSGRQRVQPSCFDDFIIALPNSIILKQFDETVSPFFHQIAILMRQITQLAKARDLLLPKLMNGEMAV